MSYFDTLFAKSLADGGGGGGGGATELRSFSVTGESGVSYAPMCAYMHEDIPGMMSYYAILEGLDFEYQPYYLPVIDGHCYFYLLDEVVRIKLSDSTNVTAISEDYGFYDLTGDNAALVFYRPDGGGNG